MHNKYATSTGQNNNTIKCWDRCAKSSILSFSSKLDSNGDWIIVDGRLLHTRTAAIGNARSTIVEHFVQGTTSDVVDVRSCRPETTSDIRLSSDDRFDGAITCRKQFVNSARRFCAAQPVKIAQKWSDMIVLPYREDQSSGCVLAMQTEVRRIADAQTKRELRFRIQSDQ